MSYVACRTKDGVKEFFELPELLGKEFSDIKSSITEFKATFSQDDPHASNIIKKVLEFRLNSLLDGLPAKYASFKQVISLQNLTEFSFQPLFSNLLKDPHAYLKPFLFKPLKKPSVEQKVIKRVEKKYVVHTPRSTP